MAEKTIYKLTDICTRNKAEASLEEFFFTKTELIKRMNLILKNLDRYSEDDRMHVYTIEEAIEEWEEIDYKVTPIILNPDRSRKNGI